MQTLEVRKKEKIPHKDWHRPEFAPKPGESKNNVKVENHTCIAEENHNTIIGISHAQRVKFVEKKLKKYLIQEILSH